MLWGSPLYCKAAWNHWCIDTGPLGMSCGVWHQDVGSTPYGAVGWPSLIKLVPVHHRDTQSAWDVESLGARSHSEFFFIVPQAIPECFFVEMGCTVLMPWCISCQSNTCTNTRTQDYQSTAMQQDHCYSLQLSVILILRLWVYNSGWERGEEQVQATWCTLEIKLKLHFCSVLQFIPMVICQEMNKFQMVWIRR